MGLLTAATTNWMILLEKIHKKRKKNYSLGKQNNKFAKALELTSQEVYIKDKPIEAENTEERRKIKNKIN